MFLEIFNALTGSLNSKFLFLINFIFFDLYEYFGLNMFINVEIWYLRLSLFTTKSINPLFRKSSENRLLYLTPVLKEDIHISGLPKLTIKLASSKKAANLSVWLVSLPWNSSSEAKITDNIITRGWADIQNYKSLTKSSDLIPGKFYKLRFFIFKME